MNSNQIVDQVIAKLEEAGLQYKLVGETSTLLECIGPRAIPELSLFMVILRGSIVRLKPGSQAGRMGEHTRDSSHAPPWNLGYHELHKMHSLPAR